MDHRDLVDDVVDMIEERLGRGENCNDILEQRDPVYTPLMRAVWADRLDLVERLIQSGANVNAVVTECAAKDFSYEISVMNVLALAINHCHCEKSLDRTRFNIIKCLIKAGANLAPEEDTDGLTRHGNHEAFVQSSSPLYIACCGQLWPVVAELLQAGCELDGAEGAGNILKVALCLAEQQERNLSDDLPQLSGIDAVKLLIDRSSTLRLRCDTNDTIMCTVVKKPLPAMLRVLLQSGKPLHGLEEAVDELDLTGFPGCRQVDPLSLRVCLDVPDDIRPRFQETHRLHGQMGSPLQHALQQLIHYMYYPSVEDKFTWPVIRRLFRVLCMLLDAGITVHTLDATSQQFLQCARCWLDKQLTESTQLNGKEVAACWQILNQAELFLCSPRRLDQLCQAHIRHSLNILGITVKDFTEQYALNRAVRGYLLYDDIVEPEELMTPSWIAAL